jgi:hypothetical protein
MTYRSTLLALVFSLPIACGPSFKDLRPTPTPTINELKSKFQLLDEVFYSTDDTFKASPQDWLGRVAVVRKSSKGTCEDNGQLQWEPTYIRTSAPVTTTPSLGYAFGDKMTDPELRAKSIVTFDMATQVAALSFLTNTLTANVIAEIVLTDFVTQRIVPSQDFENAITAFRAARKADLFDNPEVCYVIAVSGYSHKTLTKKLHTKVSDTVKGGYSGINLNGNFYSSDDSYTLDHLFELSPTVLKRLPSRTPTSAPGSDLRATAGDIKYLQAMVQKNPPAKIGATNK